MNLVPFIEAPMQISVIVPDRMILVDGLPVRFTGDPADASVRTLHYDTDAAEGAVTFHDQQSEGFKDPARLQPWLAQWAAGLTASQAAVSDAIAQAQRAFVIWHEGETARVAEEARRIQAAEEETARAIAEAKAAEDARVEEKVRAIVREMAAQA